MLKHPHRAAKNGLNVSLDAEYLAVRSVFIYSHSNTLSTPTHLTDTVFVKTINSILEIKLELVRILVSWTQRSSVENSNRTWKAQIDAAKQIGGQTGIIKKNDIFMMSL